jgi:hypothetical protein
MAKKQQGQIVETPTEARQAEPGPSVLALLTISTCLAVLILAEVWFAFFSFAPDGTAVSAPLLWVSLRAWRLAVGSGLLPSIPVFRSVRDYSQHAQCSTVPM